MIEVKIKKLYNDAVLPYYATPDSAGMDCTVHSVELDLKHKCINYGLGFAIEIPKGYVGLIFPRSSIYKTGLILSNCVGVVDSDYRGEVTAKFYDIDNDNFNSYVEHQRCCQLIIVPYPKVNLIEVDNLSETKRGTGGYGSTGL